MVYCFPSKKTEDFIMRVLLPYYVVATVVLCMIGEATIKNFFCMWLFGGIVIRNVILFCLDRIEFNKAVNRYRERLASEEQPFMFDQELLASFAQRNNVHELVEAIRLSGEHIRKLHFAIRADPGDVSSWHSWHEMAFSIGEILVTLPNLVAVSIEFSEDWFTSTAFPAVLEMFRRCQQCQELTIIDLSQGARSMPGLFLDNFTSLQAVDLDYVIPRRARLILESLANHPSLDTFAIHGFENRDTIGSAEEARLLAGVLQSPRLRSVYMDYIRFASTEVVNIFCRGLLLSHIRDFTAGNWRLPPTRADAVERILARTLTRMPALVTLQLWQISFVENPSPKFFELLGQDLASATNNTLQTLIVKDTGNDFGRLLDKAPQWRISNCTLRLWDWSETVATKLAEYIRESTQLKHLTVKKHGEVHIDVASAETLIQAFRAGTGSINTVDFEGAIDDPDLIARIKKEVALNFSRQKRIHGPRLEAIASMPLGPSRRAALCKTLSHCEATPRFEFLRDGALSLFPVLLDETE